MEYAFIVAFICFTSGMPNVNPVESISRKSGAVNVAHVPNRTRNELSWEICPMTGILQVEFRVIGFTKITRARNAPATIILNCRLEQLLKNDLIFSIPKSPLNVK